MPMQVMGGTKKANHIWVIFLIPLLKVTRSKEWWSFSIDLDKGMNENKPLFCPGKFKGFSFIRSCLASGLKQFQHELIGAIS